MTQFGDNDNWIHGFLRYDVNHTVEWLPLPLDHLLGARIGILHDGRWVIEAHEGLVDVHREGAIGLLPLLESARDEVEKVISKTILQCKIVDSSLTDFPFNEIVLQGLRSGNYWADLALNWIVSSVDESLMNARITEALQALIADKSVKQSTRHHAMRKLVMCRRVQ